MDVKKRYKKFYVFMVIFIVIYILLYALFTLLFKKFLLGLIFPLDFVVFIILFVVGIIISSKGKYKYTNFNAKYPDCVEVFDFSNSIVYGSTVLLAVKDENLILFHFKGDKEEVIPLNSIKNKEVKPFGLAQGGNPGYLKLFIETSNNKYIFSIKEEDLNKIKL